VTETGTGGTSSEVVAALRDLADELRAGREEQAVAVAAIRQTNTAQNALLRRARIERNVAIAGGAIFVLFAVLGLALILSVRSTQSTIVSCTSTTGDCAKRAQSQTAGLIAQLEAADAQAATIAAYCASTHVALVDVEECVSRNLPQALAAIPH
jgi:Mn2+/Fe2+ NRAMP family transporter